MEQEIDVDKLKKRLQEIRAGEIGTEQLIWIISAFVRPRMLSTLTDKIHAAADAKRAVNVISTRCLRLEELLENWGVILFALKTMKIPPEDFGTTAKNLYRLWEARFSMCEALD